MLQFFRGLSFPHHPHLSVFTTYSRHTVLSQSAAPSRPPSVLQDCTAPDRPGTESLDFAFLLYLVRAEMERKVESSLCLPLQTNPGARAGSAGEGERVSYRLRVIKALVQRYIETARREFEETRRKGQWLTCDATPLLSLARLGRVSTPRLTLHTSALGSSPVLPTLERHSLSVTLPFILLCSHSLIYVCSDIDLEFLPSPSHFLLPVLPSCPGSS